MSFKIGISPLDHWELTIGQLRRCASGYAKRYEDYRLVVDGLNHGLGVYIGYAFSGKNYPKEPFLSKGSNNSGMLSGDDAIEAHINRMAMQKKGQPNGN